MKIFCFFLCHFFLFINSDSLLYAERLIYFIPTGLYAVDPWRAHTVPPCPYNRPLYLDLLEEEVQARGGKLIVSDLSECLTPEGMTRLAKADTFIFCDLPIWMGGDWLKRIQKLQGKKLILCAFEPPTVIPQMYTKEILAYFQVVLTWDDSLVDNKKFFKICYPVFRGMIKNVIPFSEKRFLTMISGGEKTSVHPFELYSERIKAIKYFEKLNKFTGFEFYGTGWGKFHFRNYKGGVFNKLDILKFYRFSLCYENMKNISGYITEKMFDCFASGCVPIYWGASNVATYIPRNCFIAKEDFSSFEGLVSYLQNMKEDEYNGYILNIKNFLNSSAALRFSDKCFVYAFLPHLFPNKVKSAMPTGNSHVDSSKTVLKSGISAHEL